MKVLFAVNNEKISESIIKRYQRDYKEIISSKNVYYFNAILKELQKDKSYDRIIISEDLEPFSNNNYEAIDKFIFDKLDKISDEAFNQEGASIPIILVSTDRRTRPEPLLIKLFGIGVYDVLVGQDRSVEKVCELLNKPRSKKEAKAYYKIDSDNVDYKPENENDVSEVEIQNILAHYKKLGKNEEKYIESFDSIAVQYTDEQLKLIITFLPKNVISVLESGSSKYRQVMGLNPKNFNSKDKKIKAKNEESQKIEFIEKELNKQKLSKPVIIPTSVDTSKVKKIVDKKSEKDSKEELQRKQELLKKKKIQRKQEMLNREKMLKEQERKKEKKVIEQMKEKEEKLSSENKVNNHEEPKRRGRPPKKIKENLPNVEDIVEEPVKRKRGRPPKNKKEDIKDIEVNIEEPVKRKRGRPTKNKNIEELPKEEIKEKKISAIDDEFETLPGFDDYEDDEENDDEVLPGFDNYEDDEEDDEVLPGFDNYEDDEEEDDEVLPGFDDYEDDEEDDDEVLPGFDDYEDDEEEDDEVLPGFDDYEDDEEEDDEVLPGFDDYEDDEEDDDELLGLDDDYEEDKEEDYDESNNSEPISNPNFRRMEPISKQNSKEIENTNKFNSSVNFNIDNLISSDQKIVSFVGTSKNGTSFLVNNLAQMFSEKGIKTAILDLTQNRNAYYIYTDNREELRNIAYNCIENLRRGVAEGIQVNKNLTVYTSLPDEIEGLKDYENILETLLNNYSLVLLDCDFETEAQYFNAVQEIYLVQSLDVLTIQPLTAFLRELKAKDILNQNKLRIVINKHIRISNMSDKLLIGGMSSYNDPSMSFMTELFDKNNVKYTTIPFDQQAYSKYLDGLVDCKISLRGYSKNMIQSFNKLGNMVLPLISNTRPSKEKSNNKYNNYNSNFSNNTSDTLNKMKKKY